MKHSASSRFWSLYQDLPKEVQAIADKSFERLKSDPGHSSLHFKRIGELRSVRIGLQYRALGHDVKGGVHWFWIGTHAEYDKLVR